MRERREEGKKRERGQEGEREERRDEVGVKFVSYSIQVAKLPKVASHTHTHTHTLCCSSIEVTEEQQGQGAVPSL